MMTALQPDMAMTFGGDAIKPVAFVELKSVSKMSAELTKAMSADLCATLEARLGVPQDRIYVDFKDSEGYMFGWNGRTFG